jgi:hypothetical protein
MHSPAGFFALPDILQIARLQKSCSCDVVGMMDERKSVGGGGGGGRRVRGEGGAKLVCDYYSFGGKRG